MSLQRKELYRASSCRVATVVAALLGLSTVTLLAHQRWIAADPGSVGGIPYAGNPLSSAPYSIPYKTTIGQVLDSERNPVVGAPVVVMLAGSVVAGVATDESGLFVIKLPDVATMTLSLPLNGVFEVPIEAGEPLVVIIP